MRFIPLLILLSIVSPPAQAREITTLTPSIASPGTTVTLSGGPFREGMRLRMGEQEITPDSLSDRRLTFTVPSLPAGEYALSLHDPFDGDWPAKTLHLIDPKPRIQALTPPSLDSCSIQQGRTILLTGEFPPEARVLLDGAVVPAEKAGPAEIVLPVPALPGGMHQVEVVGADDQRSIPHALYVDNVPRIASVRQGADQVTSYEVVVTGENFLYESVLVANGKPLKRAVEKDVEGSYSALQLLGGEDYVRYLDCNTMIYIRHPVTREPDNVTLQVVNPGGEQSPVYVVAIP